MGVDYCATWICSRELKPKEVLWLRDQNFDLKVEQEESKVIDVYGKSWHYAGRITTTITSHSKKQDTMLVLKFGSSVWLYVTERNIGFTPDENFNRR